MALGIAFAQYTNIVTVPAGFDAAGFMSELMGYGAVLVGLAGLLAGYTLISKIIRRAR
jgi:hypothetical protein